MASTCKNCGKSFVGHHPGRDTYCSRACFGAYATRERSRANSPCWKGGRSRDPRGYIRVIADGHPAADKRGRVYEHVLIAEATLGRHLTKTEEVHHKDHNRANNDPANLLILHRAEHVGIHKPRLGKGFSESSRQRIGAGLRRAWARGDFSDRRKAS